MHAPSAQIEGKCQPDGPCSDDKNLGLKQSVLPAIPMTARSRRSWRFRTDIFPFASVARLVSGVNQALVASGIAVIL